VVRIDRGRPHGSLPRAALARLRTRLRACLAGSEGLLVADYGYGAAPPSILHAVPRSRLRAVTVDSRTRVAEFGSVSACTPNQEEVERALGLEPLASDAALEEAGRALLRRTRNAAVLVTRGARGMCLLERGRAAVLLPAFGTDEVADVTGAGDTVIAVFTLALLSGASYPEAAFLSNVAAGLVVLKAGTATVTPAEMLRALLDSDAK
jgi:rfaE bifunctional protein kinase chain/domain